MTDPMQRVRHELALPPDHTITPADLDEDQHPTSAWLTIGDVVDTDTWKRIRAILLDEIDQDRA